MRDPIGLRRRERSADPSAKPSVRRPLAPSDYPDSDGKPMAETPKHWSATVDAALPLMEFYRDRPDVYVGSDMMMYYQEGDPRRSVSPDVFVALGVPKLPERRVWLTWLEGKLADFVLEVTSKSTRREDEGRKARLYAELGVSEYWQFDREGDYLEPRLKGRRLGPDGKYRALSLEERDGALCHASLLGLELRLEGETLRLFDPVRGGYLQTYEESQAALRAAAVARRAAEARIEELERRLRDA